VLLRACVELGADPARTVSLTGSGAGVVAAARAGMAAIGIASGEAADALRAYGATRVADSVETLLDGRLRVR
jgi:beta-phosphoglucomutase-like phosphatase (HAD superfamily)